MHARAIRQVPIRYFDQNNVPGYAVALLRLCLLLFLVLSAMAVSCAAETSTSAGPTLKKAVFRKPSGAAQDLSGEKAGETFLVEVIRDKEGLRKGLSSRDGMPEEQGMLFVLEASEDHVFWMKGMRIPLDIIFMGKDKQITEILENLQPCRQCPLYFPRKRPSYALELNAGMARKQGLSVGDTMVIEE
ncbi:MAG: DUF192 domain-containing protein [Nitrospirae bacterium]|nr:DUF192 domain-containing protein [Nitrospirota bacterium]